MVLTVQNGRSFHFNPIILISLFPRICFSRCIEHHVILWRTNIAPRALISIKPPLSFVATCRWKPLLDALISHDTFRVFAFFRTDFFKIFNRVSRSDFGFLSPFKVEFLDERIFLGLINDPDPKLKSGVDRAMVAEPEAHDAVVFELLHL